MSVWDTVFWLCVGVVTLWFLYSNISKGKSEKTTVQDYADEYFMEYKVMCLRDLNFAKEETKRWEDAYPAILDMEIEEQSQYADYVTKKIVELPDNILQPYLLDTIKQIGIFDQRKLKASGIGNLALAILSISDEILQNDARITFEILINKQKLKI
jgi:hypothetical protein